MEGRAIGSLSLGLVLAMTLGVVRADPTGAGEAPAGTATGAPPDARAAFDRLKAMAGTWEGNVVSATGPRASVVYSVTSGGSVVEERLFPGTGHEMISMYHLDRGELVATHFCAMGNQPRMRLRRASGGEAAELVFEFAGGSNLDPAKDAHMHGGRIAFTGGDRYEAEWAVFEGGKQTGSNRFFMARTKGAPRP